MPNFAGTWKMKSSENFDELLKELGKPPLFCPLSPQERLGGGRLAPFPTTDRAPAPSHAGCWGDTAKMGPV
ncbi:hypothetical protein Z043_100632 [Scleropages formosus]|uniref:Cytosolic fatty-acid binding proteins domain-containing protein n=1 Tax=Scleropages formosus TaxID=113540 RepID=A0A0P7VBH7_SCLFO|nr:hypothetical protein Z043_100632 [Scleropages formosus]